MKLIEMASNTLQINNDRRRTTGFRYNEIMAIPFEEFSSIIDTPFA